MQADTGAKALPPPHHICVVVKDIGETAEFLSAVFGVETWDAVEATEHYKPDIKGLDELGIGESFGIKEARAKLGQLEVELLQAKEDKPSCYSEFIKSHGEGIHHIAFNISNFDDLVPKLLQQGAELVAGDFHEGKRWCFVRTNVGGILFEFLDNF